MHTVLDQRDLGKLATLSSEMVYSIDCEEQEKYDEDKIIFLHLLDNLDHQYGNCEILFDARSAVSARPFRKLDLYTVTRELVRMARNSDDDIEKHSVTPVSPVIQGSLMSKSLPANTLAC
ncbi:MAG: hypothetical protein P8Y12_08445 [Gammaproteobacteria bacterium]|jgi:hypothetical protein